MMQNDSTGMYSDTGIWVKKQYFQLFPIILRMISADTNSED